MQKINITNKFSAFENIYSGMPQVQYLANFSSIFLLMTFSAL